MKLNKYFSSKKNQYVEKFYYCKKCISSQVIDINCKKNPNYKKGGVGAKKKLFRVLTKEGQEILTNQTKQDLMDYFKISNIKLNNIIYKRCSGRDISFHKIEYLN